MLIIDDRPAIAACNIVSGEPDIWVFRSCTEEGDLRAAWGRLAFNSGGDDEGEALDAAVQPASGDKIFVLAQDDTNDGIQKYRTSDNW